MSEKSCIDFGNINMGQDRFSGNDYDIARVRERMRLEVLQRQRMKREAERHHIRVLREHRQRTQFAALREKRAEEYEYWARQQTTAHQGAAGEHQRHETHGQFERHSELNRRYSATRQGTTLTLQENGPEPDRAQYPQQPSPPRQEVRREGDEAAEGRPDTSQVSYWTNTWFGV